MRMPDLRIDIVIVLGRELDNWKSIQGLAMSYAGNEKVFEEARAKLRIQEGDIGYPQMKLLDMGFWQIGRNKENRHAI